LYNIIKEKGGRDMIGQVSLQYGLTGNYMNQHANAVTPPKAVGKVENVTFADGQNPSVSKTRPSECQACNERRYVDSSNDSNVSFKTPTHVSPEASHAMVSAHEQEHVTNAYSKASTGGGRVVYASVSLKMSVCPECHTPYVAGGVTRSQIKYNTTNPYENSRKSLEGSVLKGMRVNRSI
jgi:hypothetical protein